MARRKKKTRARRTLVIIAILILIAGFIVRRTFVPPLLHYMAYGPGATATSGTGEVGQAHRPQGPGNGDANPSENLTEQDRQQLQEVLKRKGR